MDTLLFLIRFLTLFFLVTIACNPDSDNEDDDAQNAEFSELCTSKEFDKG